MVFRTVRFLLVMVFLLHAPEAAAQYSLAVLGVDMGPGPATRAECLSNGLKRQVKRAPGFDLVPGKNLDEIKLVFGCFSETPACMAKAGKSLQVEKLLWGRMKKTTGGFNLSLVLLDVASSKVEKSAVEMIAKGDLRRTCASETVSRLAMSILSTRRAGLSIRVNISGARVTVGPRFIGLTEGSKLVNSELLPGTHLVQVKAKGYGNWEEKVTLAAGEKKVLDVTLEPLANETLEQPVIPIPLPTASQERRTNMGWKIAFWTSAAATVGLAVGMGISGSEVLSSEKDKEDAVTKYRQRIGVREALPPSHGDVCTDPRKAPGGSQLTDSEVTEIQDICDRGQQKALVTNVLIGATVAMAALAGFMYYKAYVSNSAAEDPEDGNQTVEMEKVTWSVTPSAGPEGAGLGLRLTF